jgi:hypothetical protein
LKSTITSLTTHLGQAEKIATGKSSLMLGSIHAELAFTRQDRRGMEQLIEEVILTTFSCRFHFLVAPSHDGHIMSLN